MLINTNNDSSENLIAEDSSEKLIADYSSEIAEDSSEKLIADYSSEKFIAAKIDFFLPKIQ